nr:uncharacterized protein LOC112424085 [Macaca nemestrina]
MAGPEWARGPVGKQRGSVPGNSSISLLPPRLQETETQIPPLWRGPAETGAGADPHWVTGPKPSPTQPLRPAPPPAARPRLRWEPSECLRADPRRAASVQQLSTTRTSNGKAAGLTQVSGCNGGQCPGEGRNTAFPCGNLQSGAFSVHPLCPCQTERKGKVVEQGRGKCSGVRGKLCTPIVATSISQGEIMGTEKFSNLPEVTQPVAADPAANPWLVAGGWAGKEEEVLWSRAGSRPAWSRLLTPTHPPPGRSRNVEVGPKGLCPLPVKHPPSPTPRSGRGCGAWVTWGRRTPHHGEVEVLQPPQRPRILPGEPRANGSGRGPFCSTHWRGGGEC